MALVRRVPPLGFDASVRVVGLDDVVDCDGRSNDPTMNMAALSDHVMPIENSVRETRMMFVVASVQARVIAIWPASSSSGRSILSISSSR